MPVVLRLVAVLALALVAFLVPREGGAAGPVTVKLEPQNNSGESGTATLTEEGSKTKVTVSVTGQPAGTPQPMHIHKGPCAKLDPKPTYGLPSLVDGKSEATVDVSLKDLQAGGFAINGHKSAQEASVYVYCGDIPAM